MNPNGDDRPRLQPDEQQFVRRVAELYRRPDPVPGESARFDARLARRLRSGAHTWPRLVLATAAVFALLVLAREQFGPAPIPEVASAGASSAEADSGGSTLLALLGEEPVEADEALPDEYQALASLLE